jgi:hypothetical protein
MGLRGPGKSGATGCAIIHCGRIRFVHLSSGTLQPGMIDAEIADERDNPVW